MGALSNSIRLTPENLKELDTCGYYFLKEEDIAFKIGLSVSDLRFLLETCKVARDAISAGKLRATMETIDWSRDAIISSIAKGNAPSKEISRLLRFAGYENLGQLTRKNIPKIANEFESMSTDELKRRARKYAEEILAQGIGIDENEPPSTEF